VLTHLHYDHVGTLEDFPGATFHLQEREYQFAVGRGSDSTRAGFEAADMTRLVNLFYEGRLVLQDGSASPVRGLSMHLVGGHTPGLQVVSVRTERGRVVVMSDASHFYEHFERGLSFPHADDSERNIASFAVIDELADSPEHVVPGHDPLVLARYPAVPNGAGITGAALHRPPTERLQCH
jgi:glyoxylase-like metal-dependent hydrolase (beta-lactamase superfamily II)